MFVILVIWVRVSEQNKCLCEFCRLFDQKKPKTPDEMEGLKRSQIISLDNNEIIRYVM